MAVSSWAVLHLSVHLLLLAMLPSPSLSTSWSANVGSDSNIILSVDVESIYYKISVGDELWYSSAPVMLYNGGCWYSVQDGDSNVRSEVDEVYDYCFKKDGKVGPNREERAGKPFSVSGTLRVESFDTYSGGNALGEYQALVISLQTLTNQSECLRISSSSLLQVEFRAYMNTAMVIFEQKFPNGLASISLMNPFGVAATFPSFGSTIPSSSPLSTHLLSNTSSVMDSAPLFPSRSRSLTWQRLWSHGHMREGLEGYIGGIDGGVPLISWDAKEEYPSVVSVLSPLGNYMTGRLVPLLMKERERSASKNEEERQSTMSTEESRGAAWSDVLACGLSGTVEHVPPGHTQVGLFV